MVIGEVVGRLWASRQAGALSGQKLLLVRPLKATSPGDKLIVALDALHAGPGDRVIVARGSRVRDVTVGPAVPDKDVIVGIVDGASAPVGGPARGAP
jgi:ethanolamine utilization protein EutN